MTRLLLAMDLLATLFLVWVVLRLMWTVTAADAGQARAHGFTHGGWKRSQRERRRDARRAGLIGK